MENKNIVPNSTVNDDLDFNIEEVEQVIAPQIDDGSDKPDEGPKLGNVSCSRKIWCC